MSNLLTAWIVALLLLIPCPMLIGQTEAITTIAILGCHQQHIPAPTIPFLANTLKPNYCVWVGDNVYADTETDPEYIQQQLEVLLNKEGFKKLRDVSKFRVIWDDHDYGLNDIGKKYVFKEQSKQIHRKFWQLETEIPADQDGIYYAKLDTQPNGKVIQFIMLDGRSNRDNPLQPCADAFGENQWKWLEAQLRQPADLRFIINGYQILLKRPTSWEALVKIGRSRKRLFNIIKYTGANKVLFITGDQHYVEVLRSPKVLGYKTFEIMAAGINNVERPRLAKNRVMAPCVAVQKAPVIEVHWTAEPYLHLKVYDPETGNINAECKMLLSVVKWKD
ncbi:hypothetical protein BH09BAC1_BH09BAC1_01930 [soil metagenome]